MGRIIANAMTESFSQQMIVDNRAGACSNLGAEFVARAPADGYTMLVVSTTLSANASLYKNLGYDLGRDFAPVTQLALTPHVLIVHPSLPVKTVAELGVPGSDFSNSPGLMVPAKTLPENIAILHRTAVTALKKPEVAKRINELGAIVVASAPAEYGAFVKKEMVNFG
jgi:tripartite-type tricarboxylate transporter receptor subunit TctC